MLLKELKMALVAGVFLATFASCSTDDEVSEQQLPQSEISDALKQKIQNSANRASGSEAFSEQVNWYENVNPAACGVDAMILAYEVFDLSGNSLNIISIFSWDAQGGTLESAVNEHVAMLSEQSQQEVNLVFTSGLLFKLGQPNEQVLYAEVNSYDLFLAYFDNCESTEVVFQPVDENLGQWFNINVPAPVEEVQFPEQACITYAFPLELLVVNNQPNAEPFQVTVNSEDDIIDLFSGESANITILDFVYPLSVISANGTQTTVNNAQELEQAIDASCN